VSAQEQEFAQVLRAVAERRPSLALETLDLAFLIALRVRGHGAQLASFSEAQLVDVFEQVCAVIEPAAEQRKKRATYALARLREQRLLVRVDGHGVVRSGEYALTRLASGIVDFYLDEDVLTRESLTLLSATLRSSLQQIVTAAHGCESGDDASWSEHVKGPLLVTVAELIAGIERRQRGLDGRQEEFQLEIRRLLEASWFEAIERCQSLLEATGATLRELNEILLRDSSVLLALLHDIEDLAANSGAAEAEQAALQVVDQVDRIVAWGGSRQRAWSEYFQYVHRYLRDVVRLDPTRALTQRLREQLSGNGRRFSLTVAGAPPIRLLRVVQPLAERPPVSRPRAQREREPAPDRGIDPEAVLTARVRSALDDGAASLADVTDRVNAEVDEAERFAMAGRVAQTTARIARAHAERERPWVQAGGEIEIEDWRLERARSGDEPGSSGG
jgi:chromosome partition protein MukF